MLASRETKEASKESNTRHENLAQTCIAVSGKGSRGDTWPGTQNTKLGIRCANSRYKVVGGETKRTQEAVNQDSLLLYCRNGSLVAAYSGAGHLHLSLGDTRHFGTAALIANHHSKSIKDASAKNYIYVTFSSHKENDTSCSKEMTILQVLQG